MAAKSNGQTYNLCNFARPDEQISRVHILYGFRHISLILSHASRAVACLLSLTETVVVGVTHGQEGLRNPASLWPRLMVERAE